MVQGKGILSGYDLVCKVLREKPKDPIGYLLACAHDNECDFLEFKAGMELKPENAKPGETQDDLYWDYAQAVIALVNTKGGAFVVGVNDDSHKAVGLETNDPRHVIEKRGLEAYVREEVDARLNPPDLKWRAKGGVSWRLRKTLAPYLDSRIVSFDGKDVVLVLVKPCDGPCIRVIREKQAERSEKMPIRRLGNLGRSQLLDFQDEWDDWESKRTQSSDLIERLFDQLEGESEEAACEQAIRAYYARLEEKAKCRMAEFTSLDAHERPFEDESSAAFFSPEVIELGEDDETWLKEGDEDESLDATSRNRLEESRLYGDDDCDDVDWNKSTEVPLRQGDLLSFLRDEKRIIVSGEPGGGKTTCLQHFALQFGRCANDAKPVLALFIPMGQWERACSLEQMMSKVSRLSPGQLSQLVAESRLRLVIDAVNECPDNLRPAAIRNICLYLQDRPGLQAVISTRHPEELKELGVPVFRVQPMDEAHRRCYLERYLSDRELADKLMNQILKMPGGETIAENPMLLRLVVEVYGESPSHSLPSGRAGLYRRSLQGWYRRERGKKSGGCLRWEAKQAIGILSELAYRSRLNGYRDVPLEFVRELWGIDAEVRLQELCQGPVVYLDDEFVRFRHETFQEYLCAEFLVHHEELPEWGPEDYPRWGMVFAYAVELFDSDPKGLPQSFWLAAWKLDPWLGAALTSAATWAQLVRPDFKGVRPIVNGMPLGVRKDRRIHGAPYSFAVSEYVPSPKALRWSLRNNRNGSWYQRDNAALRYVVLIDQSRMKHWRRFELAQVPQLRGLGMRYAISLVKSWLIIKDPRECLRHHILEEWGSWISQAKVSDAERLITCHIAIPADFAAAKVKWMDGMTIQLSVDLIRKRLLSRDDLRDRIPFWISSAKVKEAIDMVRAGLARVEDFKGRMKEWIGNATPKDAYALVTANFLGREAFDPKVHQWIEEVKPQSSQWQWLIKGGWATMEDLGGKMPSWMQSRQGLWI